MDARELRNVFGSFVTGVTVVTTVDAEGRDQGVTANSFSSVSLDPPLVLWSQANSARSFPAFRDASRFIVNILAEHQRDLSQRFASSGADKFQDLPVERRDGGLPALPECCAYVECRKVAMYPGGDHTVYLGEVLAIDRSERRPLAFARGRYMVAFEHELNVAMSSAAPSHAAHHDAVRLASAALPELAKQTMATVGAAVWGNRGATFIRWETADTDAGIELRTGVVMSPLSSAAGLLFGAYLPEELTSGVTLEALSVAAAEGGNTEALRDAYKGEIAEVLHRGMAVSRHVTHSGNYGFAAPVFDRSGHMVIALCAVVGKSHDEARVALVKQSLQDAARALSRRLGHSGRIEKEPAASQA